MFGNLVLYLNLYPQTPGLCSDLAKQLEELLGNTMGCSLFSASHDFFSGTLFSRLSFAYHTRAEDMPSTLEPPCQRRSALPGDCLFGIRLQPVGHSLNSRLAILFPSLFPAVSLPPALLAFLNSFILSLLPFDL